LSSDADVVGIDEAQFFDAGMANVCETLALEGIRVIAAGLDMDYLGKPFGPMPELLAIADHVTKLHAICVKCGNIANFSYRKIAEDAQVALGERQMYEPRCRACYHKIFRGIFIARAAVLVASAVVSLTASFATLFNFYEW
jgi:thymidine kinase